VVPDDDGQVFGFEGGLWIDAGLKPDAAAQNLSGMSTVGSWCQ
jgi:hypothetical protein